MSGCCRMLLLPATQTLPFVRRDETGSRMLAWIDAIADGWKARDVTPAAYAAGTSRARSACDTR